MQSSMDEIEQLWELLLSRQPELVQQAYQGLAKEEQEAVMAHLKRMVDEPDWHPEQRISAQAALDALS